jgi:bacteriocin-like protein
MEIPMSYNPQVPASRELTDDELNLVSGGEKDLPYTAIGLLTCFAVAITETVKPVVNAVKAL